MKEINVFAHDSHLAGHFHGEAMLDTDEGTLTIIGDDPNTVIRFNWNHVLGYIESPLVEAEEGTDA